MDDLNPGKENKNLDAIRHFKGTWKNFEEFWKSKGARMSPWEDWEQKYPEEKKMKKKDPIHLYKTFDDESDEVKESSSTLDFLPFDQFVTESKKVKEDNMVPDIVPMQKPFVLKRKKRKGSNEDDEEDDTQEVANMNTVGVGAR